MFKPEQNELDVEGAYMFGVLSWVTNAAILWFPSIVHQQCSLKNIHANLTNDSSENDVSIPASWRMIFHKVHTSSSGKIGCPRAVGVLRLDFVRRPGEGDTSNPLRAHPSLSSPAWLDGISAYAAEGHGASCTPSHSRDRPAVIALLDCHTPH